MTKTKEAIYAELLLLRCQRGDAGAFEELVRRWEQRLFYYVRRLVEQEADAWDVLQKTWLKVFGRLKELRDPGALACWLYATARTTAIDHLRRRPGWLVPHDPAEENLDPPVEDDPGLALENVEAVHAALGRLSPPHREVLTLFFLQDLSVEEIAEVVGVPVGTIKSRLYYARRAAKAVLEEGLR